MDTSASPEAVVDTWIVVGHRPDCDDEVLVVRAPDAVTAERVFWDWCYRDAGDREDWEPVPPCPENWEEENDWGYITMVAGVRGRVSEIHIGGDLLEWPEPWSPEDAGGV
jgi:hypothetical protein